jgi:hypothetical protein
MSARHEHWIDVADERRLDRERRRFQRKFDTGTATRADVRRLVRQFGRTFGWHRRARPVDGGKARASGRRR